MSETGVLHPQLTRVLAKLRHKDTIITGGVGLPIPKRMERVDPDWRPGDPAYLDVLEEILKYIVVEGAVFADRALTVTSDFHREALDLLPQGLPVEYISHTELKGRNKDVEAIVLTGESTGCTDVILSARYAY